MHIYGLQSRPARRSRTFSQAKSLQTVLALLAASWVTAFLPSPAAAQLAPASASTLGLAGNHTATASGFAAMSANPAGLAMPGSGFSLALVPVQVREGLGPVTVGDLADWQGEVVPSSTKEEWLGLVEGNGGQVGLVGADVSGLALTIGNFGLQHSTVMSGSMRLPPGVVEAILYGNSGRTGSVTDLSLVGAGMDGYALSTVGVGMGIPLGGEADRPSAIGATVKYTMGHAVITGRSDAGELRSDPVGVDISFPMLRTLEDEVESVDNGTGIGLDVGFMAKRGALSLGATLLNVFHTFEWDQEKLGYVPGTAVFDEDFDATDFDEAPVSEAPPALLAQIEDLTLKPELRVGVGLDVGPSLTLTADLHNRFSEGGIELSPKFHLGAGAEYRGLRILHLRGGAAAVTDGMHYGGGATLVLGPVNLTGAVLARRTDYDEGLSGQFTFSLWNR